MFRRGDVVNILHEFRNPGDNLFVWVVMDDNWIDDDVEICPIKLDSSIGEVKTLKAHMLEYKNINLIHDHIEPAGPQLDFIAL